MGAMILLMIGFVLSIIGLILAQEGDLPLIIVLLSVIAFIRVTELSIENRINNLPQQIKECKAKE